MHVDNVSTRLIRDLGCAMVFCLLCASSAPAQDFVEHEVYVKMDYWESAGDQSAEAWHFDPDNGNQWTQLPNDPNPPDARERAKFTIKDLLEDAKITQFDTVWFLGVKDIQVVGGQPGSFQNLSLNEAYSEMIDMMVFSFHGEASGMVAHDPCGSRIWPIATGSEMTPYVLHEHPDNAQQKYYGMKLNSEEIVASAAWRWKNPADVAADEDVYIEFTLKFDYHKTNEAYAYINCGVSWISAAGGCDYNFCLTGSTATKVGTPFDMDIHGPIVVAVPHTLDHATVIRLYKRVGTQDTLLVQRNPDNSNNYYTAHRCEPDGGEIAWHVHTSGQYGHLKVRGYEQWQGNEDPGDGVFTAAAYNVSPHSSSAPTNHRGLFIIFWERGVIPP